MQIIIFLKFFNANDGSAVVVASHFRLNHYGSLLQ